MQTAVTTFQRRTENGSLQNVELHAQLHYGDASYFDHYNSRQFNADKTAVLYELLVDEHLLDFRQGTRRLLPIVGKSPVSASPIDQATALQYGWSCQVDGINYSLPGWIHADLTRQEFLHRLRQQQEKGAVRERNVPLWQLASPSTSPLPLPGAAAEAATALLVGPPVFGPSATSNRRLFTNLFLPGDSLVSALRAALWWTVPSPEISVLLLDWSSLLMSDFSGKKRDVGGGLFAPVTGPLVQALTSGRFDLIRQLTFGQAVVAGAAAQQVREKNNDDLLVTQRNDHALQVLKEQLGKKQQNVALLYGCNHCPDLHVKLQAEGFAPLKTEWRTAWSVALSNQGAATDQTTRTALVSLFVLLPLYFVVGGMDWISTLRDVAEAADTTDFVTAAADASLYLVRHVLLYVGLSRFLIDWEKGDWGLWKD
jgi:hypothetical protein